MTASSLPVGGHGPHDDPTWYECLRCARRIAVEWSGPPAPACSCTGTPRPMVLLREDGPHDDPPHWTVELTDPDDILVLDSDTPTTAIGVEVWDGEEDVWVRYDAGSGPYAALVRAVRDAAEVPALRTHATTLARARRIAILTQEAADTKDYAAYDLGVGSLLDLLTGETDG